MCFRKILPALLSAVLLFSLGNVLAFADNPGADGVERVRLSTQEGTFVQETFTFSQAMPGDTIEKVFLLECLSKTRPYLQISAKVDDDLHSLLEQSLVTVRLKYADQTEYLEENTFTLDELFAGRAKHNLYLKNRGVNLVDMALSIQLPTTLGNEYQGAVASFILSVRLYEEEDGSGSDSDPSPSAPDTSSDDFSHSKDVPDSGSSHDYTPFAWLIAVISLLLAISVLMALFVIRRKSPREELQEGGRGNA